MAAPEHTLRPPVRLAAGDADPALRLGALLVAALALALLAATSLGAVKVSVGYWGKAFAA